MKRFLSIVAPVLAIAATGCLATKGDIRLLQDDLMKSRAQLARTDSAHQRTSDSLAMAISALAIASGSRNESLMKAQLAFVARTDSGLKALNSKLTNLEINTREQFKAQGDLIAEVQELARQNSKTLTTRPPVETPKAPPITPTAIDSSGAPPPQPTTDPATLLISGRSSVQNGSCVTARRTFNELLAQFPNSPQAPEALYAIAASYTDCGTGNPVAADSVYQLVTLRYPKNDRAADALYKRAELAKADGKAAEAQKLYQRIFCEYPRSTIFPQANEKLTVKGRCT